MFPCWSPATSEDSQSYVFKPIWHSCSSYITSRLIIQQEPISWNFEPTT